MILYYVRWWSNKGALYCVSFRLSTRGFLKTRLPQVSYCSHWLKQIEKSWNIHLNIMFLNCIMNGSLVASSVMFLHQMSKMNTIAGVFGASCQLTGFVHLLHILLFKIAFHFPDVNTFVEWIRIFKLSVSECKHWNKWSMSAYWAALHMSIDPWGANLIKSNSFACEYWSLRG